MQRAMAVAALRWSYTRPFLGRLWLPPPIMTWGSSGDHPGTGRALHPVSVEARDSHALGQAYARRLFYPSRLGVVDQRKAGARAKVQYVALLEGTAGDYLVIPDLATGTRTVYSGPEFDAAFAPIPEARSGTRSPP